MYFGVLHCMYTVEPRLSGMAILSKMGGSAAVTMDTGMFIFCACADPHIHCYLSIKWVDQGVVYLFDYSGTLYSGHPWGTKFWPLLRGCFVHKLFIWDLSSWPLYRGGLYSGVAIKRGSTVSGIIISIIRRQPL